MKRVVIIGPDFVPSSLPPALRIRFFAAHLPEFGWRPLILSTWPAYYEHKCDPENERLLPPWLEVLRTEAIPARWSRKVGIGDIGMRSLLSHWRALSRICRRRRPDLIFIPVPPYVPMILGRLAHQRFRIPYVIDYIDPWVTEYYWRLPRKERPPKWRLAYWTSRVLEPPALRFAAAISGVSQGTLESVLSAHPWRRGIPMEEIPYGAEPADFEYLRQHPRANPIFKAADGNFHISYVGACIPQMYGAVRALFRGIKIGLERSPALFDSVRVHFVGTSYASTAGHNRPVERIAAEEGLIGKVDEWPSRVPYLDALAVLLASGALVLLGSEEAHYTASKLFPNVLARRPLIAIFHEESSVVRILAETGAGHTITFGNSRRAENCGEDVYSILEAILASPNAWQPRTDWAAFQRYTAREMTRRLAALFDRATERRELPVEPSGH